MDKKQIKELLAVIAPNSNINYLRYVEKRKFRDQRRQAIANDYQMTKEEKAAVDDLFCSNYGEKIDYVWHKNYAAHAGKFDCRFFPELLYIPEFEAFQNQNKAAVRMMSDKNFLPLIAKAAGVKMPRTVISCTNGILRDSENHIIDKEMANDLLKEHGAFFVKPSVDSCSGQGCLKVNPGTEFCFNGSSLCFSTPSGGGIFKILSVRNSLPATNQSDRYILAA